MAGFYGVLIRLERDDHARGRGIESCARYGPERDCAVVEHEVDGQHDGQRVDGDPNPARPRPLPEGLATRPAKGPPRLAAYPSAQPEITPDDRRGRRSRAG